MNTQYQLGDIGKIGLGLLNTVVDPEKFLKEKLERARNLMKRYGLGVILCLTEPDVSYVTNIPPLGALSAGVGGYRYAILPEKGEPVYFDECDTAYHLAKQFPYIKVDKSIPVGGGVFFSSPPQAQQHMLGLFVEQIKDTLKDLKLEKDVLGVDANIPYLLEALKKGLKSEVSLDGAKALTEARMIKTPTEQRIFRVLAGVVDGCFEVAYKKIKVGVSEQEVWSEIVKYQVLHGVEPGGYIISGQHSWPKDVSRSCTDRLFRVGDTVVIDIFNSRLLGYCSCCYRSFSVGPAPKDVKEAYKKAITLLREAEKALKPGATTKDVVEKWPDEVELWSKRPPYVRDEREKFSTFFNNMGHGLGIATLYDPPFFWRPIAVKWPVKLEAGMVISLETQEGTPDNRCGVRIEDMIIITDAGYEIISKWPADEITEVQI